MISGGNLGLSAPNKASLKPTLPIQSWVLREFAKVAQEGLRGPCHPPPCPHHLQGPPPCPASNFLRPKAKLLLLAAQQENPKGCSKE